MGSARLFDIAPADWARLRALLDEALALPAAARAAWLAALPPEQAALKDRLRGLLAHAEADQDDAEAGTGGETEADRRPGGAVGERPTRGPWSPRGLRAPDTASVPGPRFGRLPRLAPLGPAPAAPTPPTGTGPYRAIRLLGEGGMGRVWLAERTDLLHGRPVALKLPHACSPHPQLAERMAREREILAVLDHPHIARIYDAGVTPDGQPWLALEYVEGEPIDAFANARGLDVRARIALFLQVTAAVAHAHARLVVHLDLKPGNILVSAAPGAADATAAPRAPRAVSADAGPPAEPGQVRLLDFGIAKLLAPPGAPPPGAPTAPAQRAHTPHYAAPEQVLGRPVGTAADLYALGVVLYELLTGTLPYRPRRATPAALEEAILAGDPPRASSRAADPATRRALAGDLDAVLAKALKQDPAARYATAQALADDLARWRDGRPVSAQPDSAWYHARKFVRRHRWGVAGVAGVALALGTATGVALWQAQQARLQAAKAGAITDFLIGLFRANDIEQADGAAKRAQSVQDLLAHSADALAGPALADQPALRGELQRVVGGLLNDLEIPQAAIRVRQARVAGLRAAGADAAALVPALRELGQSLRDHSEWPAARAALAEAEALCARAPALAGCPGVQLDLGRVDFAERRLDAAFARVAPLPAALAADADAADALPAAQAGWADDLAGAHELLALLHVLRNQPAAADAAFRAALALREAAWGPGSVRLAQMRYRFGRHLWTLRRLAAAEAEMHAAWQATRAALGDAHVASARNQLYLGRLQVLVGQRPAEGLAHLRQAHATLLAQAARLDPAELYEAEATWANALTLDGRLAEADSALQAAAARRRALGARAGPDSTLDLSQARWWQDTGRFAEARALLGRLHDAAATQFGPRHPTVADRAVRLAALALAAGDRAAVEPALQAALATDDTGEDRFGSAKHRARLLQVQQLVAEGRADEALAQLQPLRAHAAATPRSELYRETQVLLHEVAAQALAAAGRPAEALPHLDAAIDALAASHAQHPTLAVLHAARGQALWALGDAAGARRQATRAQAVLAAQPAAGPQFRRPLAALRAMLVSTATPARPAAPPWAPRVSASGGPNPSLP